MTARRIESEAEAVQVMTVWTAKGLEFPIVCLPTLWRRTGGTSPVIYVDPDTGQKAFDVGKGKTWPDADAGEAEEGVGGGGRGRRAAPAPLRGPDPGPAPHHPVVGERAEQCRGPHWPACSSPPKDAPAGGAPLGAAVPIPGGRQHRRLAGAAGRRLRRHHQPRHDRRRAVAGRTVGSTGTGPT